MQIEVTHNGDVCVITPLESRIDAYVARAFRAALLEQIEQGRTSLLVNLSRVQFMDSSGLGALVSALKRLGRAGELRVCGPTDTVRSMLELTRLTRVIPIADVSAISGSAL